MEELKYSQSEMLELINQYQTADRKLIKLNLKRILTEQDIKPKEIIELGYTSTNTYSWLAPTANNIPLFHQSLHIACEFNFDVKEFLKEI
jgi:hypothetical protein